MLASVEAEIQEDMTMRASEIQFLENLRSGLDLDDCERLNRSILLMIYAHLEGHVKFCLDVYVRFLNEESVRASAVLPILSALTLHSEFAKLRNPQTSEGLPSELRDFSELRKLSVEKSFIEGAREFEDRVVLIDERIVDLESNLKPKVLRKNLYRLGICQSFLAPLQDNLNRLLGKRNNIAHGASSVGIGDAELTELKVCATEIASRVSEGVLSAVSRSAHLSLAR